MRSEEPQNDVKVRRDERIPAEEGGTGAARLSRRQAIGHMSAVAAAGAVAWAVPEILTAKPAAGATLSNPDAASVGVWSSSSTDPAGFNGPEGVTTAVHTAPAAHAANSLAFTGLNIQRDAEVGAALVAGGWAMQHWASRAPKPAVSGTSRAHEVDKAAVD
jgi:hypothetical protein